VETGTTGELVRHRQTKGRQQIWST
jgi:hypothetical protein